MVFLFILGRIVYKIYTYFNTGKCVKIQKFISRDLQYPIELFGKSGPEEGIFDHDHNDLAIGNVFMYYSKRNEAKEIFHRSD